MTSAHPNQLVVLLACLVAVVGRVASGAEPDPIPDPVVELGLDSAMIDEGGQSIHVKLAATIAEGWHVNAHEPTLEELVPTTLTVEPPTGWSVTSIGYPEPESFAFDFAGGEELAVYSGTALFDVLLQPTGAVPSAGVSLHVSLRAQACDDTRCLRPTTVSRTFVIRSLGPTAESPPPAASSSSPVAGWLADLGLLPTLALVTLMGLGLNLTPCVYPLISVTLAYFGGQGSGGRRHVVGLATIYVFGIAITFSTLGVVAALSGGLFGAALQRPGTLVGIASLLVLLALSNFGLYTFRLPSRLTERAGSAAAGALGALFMGLTMGIVAAPCVGPIIVGLLLTVAAINDPFLGFVLFFALAVGMGAPYVALAAAAGSIRRLPRSGEWLAWVEHLFGFVLLGLALYFLMPVIPHEVFAWLVPGLLAVAGAYLGFLDPNGRRLRFFPAFRASLGIVAIAGAVWAAWPTSTPQRVEWTPYSAEALRGAAASGRPAVVDFRADWCLPCIEMEHSTFVEPSVTELARDFAMLQADVTEMSEAQEATLSSHEVVGVPTTLFFDRTGREHHRAVGYVSPEAFREILESTLTAP